MTGKNCTKMSDGFWQESVKLLQFYNKTLPATLIVDESKLL